MCIQSFTAVFNNRERRHKVFSWLSWLTFSPVFLAILGAFLFMIVLFPAKDPFYWSLNWLLETDVPFFKVVGELLSWVASFVKACGVYCIINLVGVSLTSTTLGSVLMLTLPIFLARHFVYPAAFKAATTVSRVDDIILILDIAILTIGVYQTLFWGLTGYRLF